MRFADFIGNAPIVAALREAIGGGRVANAYLLAGPGGTGKRTLALLCAQALLCDRFEREPCGACDSCRRFEAIRRAPPEGEPFHPDLRVVEPQGKFIVVDQVRRDLVAATQMRPYQGARQVFVIDPAEAMNPSAANAFLKTLEEAPGGSVFFLVSSRPASLLPTVLSRCQRFNFQRLDREDLARELESRGLFAREEALAVAGLSRGAPGVALSFDLERHRRQRDAALEFARLAVGEGEVERVFDLAGRMAKEKESFEERLELAAALLRDLMLIASAGSGVRVVNEEIKGELLELARGRSPRKLARLLSRVAEMREPLIRNVRVDSVCERLMLDGRELMRQV